MGRLKKRTTPIPARLRARCMHPPITLASERGGAISQHIHALSCLHWNGIHLNTEGNDFPSLFCEP